MDVGENETDEMEALNTEQAVRLSLQALAKGPRLRLLLITLEQLNKEVLNFQENGSHLRQDWSEFFIQRICDIIIPICRLWIFGEHKESLENGHVKIKDQYTVGEHFDQNLVIEWNSLFDSYPEGYGGYKTMKRSLMATGKAEFYAEFLYSSCSGSLRRNSFCGTEMHSNEVVSVLEDLIINVADKAAALYLDLISNGGSICNWQWSNIMSKSISSTRLLEKFRNEVALNGWLNDNFQSVTAMFEDRFDLWILKSHEDDSNNEIRQVQKVGVIHKKQNPEARKYSVVSIRPSKLFARRGKELRALTGWRYYFSLYLEFSDISGPILRTIITKLGEGISFLLVILIGRSLGLIYRGIRQSLQWNSS
ncbi:hypothetical protein KP509_17G006600 [Ceratopteris richardii]|nr:hypothetical protein KP509_17G006600 [Ceratopteris richardii]